MSVFNFKRFAVVNERSAMKVNTDGVLLGAAMTILDTDRTMLDVGTGTGTIALMAAQRVWEGNVGKGIPGQARNDVGETWNDVEGTRNDVGETWNDVEGARNDVGETWNDVEGARNDVGETWNDVEGAQNDAGKPGMLWEVRIDAIDIDGASAEEAGMNFMNSPWSGNMKAHHASLDEFSRVADTSYDLIFSNPPYFEDSLLAPEQRRCNARHTVGLSYRELLEFAAQRLTENGRFSVVLPAEQEQPLTRCARMNGLHLFRILRIRTVPRKVPGRIIAEFSRERCDKPEDSILTIQNEGKYTEEYLSLMHDFYLFA